MSQTIDQIVTIVRVVQELPCCLNDLHYVKNNKMTCVKMTNLIHGCVAY